MYMYVDGTEPYQIRNRALIAHKPLIPRITEMLLQHSIQLPCRIPVAVLSVWYIVRAFAHEVVALRLHWADIAILDAFSHIEERSLALSYMIHTMKKSQLFIS